MYHCCIAADGLTPYAVTVLSFNGKHILTTSLFFLRFVFISFLPSDIFNTSDEDVFLAGAMLVRNCVSAVAAPAHKAVLITPIGYFEANHVVNKWDIMAPVRRLRHCRMVLSHLHLYRLVLKFTAFVADCNLYCHWRTNLSSYLPVLVTWWVV